MSSNEVMVSKCWSVLGILLIEDFEVFIYVFLSRFRCWLILFVIRGKRLLVRAKELGCK